MKKTLSIKSKAGMSLVELMLVTVLLAFISISAFRSVRSTLNVKKRIDFKTENIQEFRAVLSLLDRDLRSVFFVVPEDLGWKTASSTEDEQDPNLDPNSPFSKKPNPISIFQGTSDSLFFSSQSHQRMASNSAENQQHFVLYQLKDKEFIRGESVRAVNIEDREDPEKYRTLVLLENTTSLEFEYWSAKKEDWVDRWDSENKETFNQIPEAVKINITYKVDMNDERKGEAPEQLISTAIRIPEGVFRNHDWKAHEKELKKAQESADKKGAENAGGDEGGT